MKRQQVVLCLPFGTRPELVHIEFNKHKLVWTGSVTSAPII